MEQRIEIFSGCQVTHKQGRPASHFEGNAFEKARQTSEVLLKEGWFIQEMVSQDFELKNGGFQSQLMVVYRRKA